MTEDSSPTATPVARTPGRSRPPYPADPGTAAAGVTTTPATAIAIVSPDDPRKRRPVDALSSMYAAQQVAATSAKATPDTASPAVPAPPRPPWARLAQPLLSSATPAPARPTQTRSISRREDATATASGPRNSMVTAMPSGIRANDW